MVSTGMVLLFAAQAQARNLRDILKQKGVLNDVQYNECIAEHEKEEVKTQKTAQDVLASKWPKWLDMLTPFGDLRIRQVQAQPAQHPLFPINEHRTRSLDVDLA